MPSDYERVQMAIAAAKKSERERKEAPDGNDGGLYLIEIPKQQLWLFTRNAALRAVEAMSILGVKARMKVGGMK